MHFSPHRITKIGSLISTDRVILFVIFSLLYYGAVVVGLASRIDYVALFWPANGVAFGFFILRPKREWPVYLIGLSMGYIAGMYATGDYSWSIILGALQANIIQTVIGAWLVQRYVPLPIKFTSVREILITLFCTAFVGSFASAAFSVAVLGPGFMETPWQLWASGVIDNAGSTMLILPFILVFISTFSISALRMAHWKRWLEGLILTLIAISLTEYVFTISNSADVLMRTLPYLLVPCILWGGLRFGQKGVTSTVLFIGVESIRHTLQGEGPFAGHESGFLLILTIHLYIGIIAITGLIVAALIKQQVTVMKSLAGGIAHEMRNPLSQFQYTLSKIRNYIRDADIDEVPEKTAQFLKQEAAEAEHAIRRSGQIIDFILDGIHEKEINRADFEYISAKSVLAKVMHEYSYESAIDRDKVSVKIQQDFLFKGDETLLVYVLFNLLKNALYYLKTDPGSSIELSAESTSVGNVIIVRDTGPGIPQSLIPHLFDNFFTAGKKGGTGLGLAYCQRIMRAFNGGIRCESVEGEFTKFLLVFPRVSETELTHDQKRVLKILENKRILFVDDDQDFIDGLLTKLPENKLNITRMDNVQQAVMELKARPFDLLVLDVSMQESGGYKAVRRIRKGDVFSRGECTNHKTLPVMAFTDETGAHSAERAATAGATTFLSKDCHSIDFITGLLSCIDLSEKQLLAEHAKYGLKNLTVMVVDDQKINLAQYREILEPIGIKVIEAEGGKAALGILDKMPCDVIISDLNMPEMDGYTFAEAIRSGESFSQFRTFESVPIIVVSGDPSIDNKALSNKAGINRLLSKPVDSNQLLEMLVELLSIEAPRNKFDEDKGNEKLTLNLSTKTINNVGSNDEALAKLVHDILTPILTLEYSTELLQQYLPVLVQCYLLGEGLQLTQENIAGLKNVPVRISQIAQANRLKTAYLSRKFSHSAEHNDEFTQQFLDDIELLWSHVESIHRYCLVATLPVLLKHYEAAMLGKKVENGLGDVIQDPNVIDEESWIRLNHVEAQYSESIQRVKTVFHEYENSIAKK